ncbi:MAG: hypothetical protein HYU67_07710 [Flavobacteriia bacterium]|nr:hypothetical protein [Flavobacteriia bacterium]
MKSIHFKQAKHQISKEQNESELEIIFSEYFNFFDNNTVLKKMKNPTR